MNALTRREWTKVVATGALAGLPAVASAQAAGAAARLPNLRRYLHYDVFTDRRFGGNQLAIFPDARGIAEEHLLPIAREFNYSETTFVYPPRDPAHTRRVRR